MAPLFNRLGPRPVAKTRMIPPTITKSVEKNVTVVSPVEEVEANTITPTEIPNRPGEITLCTVHFNTPELLDALLKSIELHVPSFHLYVFDNSDKLPYHTDNPNVTIIDNTRGQIINFDKWLEGYPNRFKSSEGTKTFGSAKHCYTINKCMELLNTNFILLDSDILLKRDITPLFDERYLYVGESMKQNGNFLHRVVPFLCFINVTECKRQGVKYFDDNYMHGLHNTKNNPRANDYDTGAAFYVHTRNKHYKEVRVDDYIVHYKGGSWHTQEQKIHGSKISPTEWLENNKQYWYNEPLTPVKCKAAVCVNVSGGLKHLHETVDYHIAMGFDGVVIAVQNEKYNQTINAQFQEYIKNGVVYVFETVDSDPFKVFGMCKSQFDFMLFLGEDELLTLDSIYKSDIKLFWGRVGVNNKQNISIERQLTLVPQGDDISSLIELQFRHYKHAVVPNCTPALLICNDSHDEIRQVKQARITKFEVAPHNMKVIYTCITGNYDTLKEIKQIPGWDYICFTDQQFKSKVWQIRPLPQELRGLSNVRKQRYIKLNPHLYLSDYELSVWIDGNIELINNPDNFIQASGVGTNRPIAFKKHPARNCIYKECDACASIRKDNKQNTDNIKNYYKSLKYPQNNGLYETNVIIRYHNHPDCIKLMKAWTQSIFERSHRDQLSINFCVWQLHCESIIAVFDMKVFRQFFKLGNAHTSFAGKSQAEVFTKFHKSDLEWLKKH